MRRKPICSANTSLSAALPQRRSSITRRSASEKLKNASTSKALRSRGKVRRPRHVDCQSCMCRPSVNQPNKLIHLLWLYHVSI
jgi:hypothetical protein